MSEQLVQDGKLYWTGEHWINYIRREGETSDSGMVSLFHTRYSKGGSGNAAFVDIGGDDGYRALCTDNADVASFMVDHQRGNTGRPYGQNPPIVDAEFIQGGDIRTSPSWTIRTDDREIVATWSAVLPVVVVNGPWPAGSQISYTFTLLHFAEGASIALDGRAVDGRPYPTDIWRKSIGGERSSCVFALAETFIGDA